MEEGEFPAIECQGCKTRFRPTEHRVDYADYVRGRSKPREHWTVTALKAAAILVGAIALLGVLSVILGQFDNKGVHIPRGAVRFGAPILMALAIIGWRAYANFLRKRAPDEKDPEWMGDVTGRRRRLLIIVVLAALLIAGGVVAMTFIE
jgi:heme A synthase